MSTPKYADKEGSNVDRDTSSSASYSSSHPSCSKPTKRKAGSMTAGSRPSLVAQSDKFKQESDTPYINQDLCVTQGSQNSSQDSSPLQAKNLYDKTKFGCARTRQDLSLTDSNKRPRPTVPAFSKEHNKKQNNVTNPNSNVCGTNPIVDTNKHQPILCLRSINNRNCVWPLNTALKTKFLAGRNQNIVDVVIPGKSVSRVHAELCWDVQFLCWRIIDRSMAGVFVNGRRIPNHTKKGNLDSIGYALHLFDKICFGMRLPDTTFDLECWTSPVARLVCVQSSNIRGNVPNSFLLDARIRHDYTIGRSHNMVQFPIVHPQLSRIHIQFKYENIKGHDETKNGNTCAKGGLRIFHWVALDKISRNGTFINSLRLSAGKTHRLAHGDNIVLGDLEGPAVSFRFEYVAGILAPVYLILVLLLLFCNSANQDQFVYSSSIDSSSSQTQSIPRELPKLVEVRVVEKIVKDPKIEAQNVQLKATKAALQQQIINLEQKMKAVQQRPPEIKEVPVEKEVIKEVVKEIEVVREVEKIVKDPKTEALAAELQKQREKLQQEIETLRKKQKETAYAAKRHAKVKADIMEFSWSCCICQDYLVKSRLLSCGHTFCQSCIEEWLELNRECPKCRRPSTAPPTPNTILDETMTKCILELKDFGDGAAKEYKERLDEWKETYSEAKKRIRERKGLPAVEVQAQVSQPPANHAILTVNLVGDILPAPGIILLDE